MSLYQKEFENSESSVKPMAITLSMTPAAGCSTNRLASDVRKIVKTRYPEVAVRTRNMGVASGSLVVASVVCPPEMVNQPKEIASFLEDVRSSSCADHFGVELDQSLQLATEI